MISFVKGFIDHVLDTSIIIDTGALGYQVFVAERVIVGLGAKSDEVKLYTYMSVKDDGISLYGFLEMEELNLFNRLITVSGIGPKVAMAMLNSLTPSQIMNAIVTNDEKSLTQAPGLGRKTAARLILELKDKIKTDELIAVQDDFSGSRNNEVAEAIEALISLGYSRQDTVRAVYSLDTEGLSVEDVIKMALKKLAKF